MGVVVVLDNYTLPPSLMDDQSLEMEEIEWSIMRHVGE